MNKIYFVKETPFELLKMKATNAGTYGDISEAYGSLIFNDCEYLRNVNTDNPEGIIVLPPISYYFFYFNKTIPQELIDNNNTIDNIYYSFDLAEHIDNIEDAACQHISALPNYGDTSTPLGNVLTKPLDMPNPIIGGYLNKDNYLILIENTKYSTDTEISYSNLIDYSTADIPYRYVYQDSSLFSLNSTNTPSLWLYLKGSPSMASEIIRTEAAQDYYFCIRFYKKVNEEFISLSEEPSCFTLNTEKLCNLLDTIG